MTIDVKKTDRKLYEFSANGIDFKIKVVTISTVDIRAKVLMGDVFESEIGELKSIKFVEKMYKKASKKITPIDEYFTSDAELREVLIEVSDKIRELAKVEMQGEEIPDDKTDVVLNQRDILNTANRILRKSKFNKQLVGQDAMVLLAFLGMISAKTEYPVNLDGTGPSSSGKTIAFVMVSNAFHDDDKMVIAGGSKTSLKYDVSYTDNNQNYIIDIDQKIIMILEKEESIELIKMMKPILSHDKFELEYKVSEKGGLMADMDEETRRTSKYIMRGYPCAVTMSVQNPENAEMLSRELITSPDTSPEQIKAVCQEIVDSAMRFPDERQIHSDLPLLQHSLRRIKKAYVMNPFFKLISDIIPMESCRIYRDLDKFKSLVEAMTLLHHRNRLCATIGEETMYVSSLEDNIVAFSVIDKVFRASFIGVSERSMDIFALMEKMNKRNKQLIISHLLEFARGNEMKMPKTELEAHLYSLEDKGMITYDWGRPRGINRDMSKQKLYKISDDIKEFNQVAVLTPIMIESFYYNMVKIFEDEKVTRLLELSEIPKNLNVGGAMDGWIKKMLGKLGLDNATHKKIRCLLDVAYCNDKDSFIQNILHSETKKIFAKDKWWENMVQGSRENYEKHQKYIESLQMVLRDETNPEEREEIVRAMEDAVEGGG